MQSCTCRDDRSRQWAICIVFAVTAVSGTLAHAQEAGPLIRPSWTPVTIQDINMVVDDPPSGLSLENLEAFALVSNPSIERAEAIVAAARGRALQVGLRPNPQVGIDFQQLGSSGLAEQYGVLIGQEFVRSDKLGLNRSIALHEVQRLEQELAAQRQRVLTDVRIAFVRALRAERQVELTQQLVDIGPKGVAVAEELLNAKEVGRADVLQAELEVESALVLRQNAENRRIAAWRQLSALTSQSSLEPQPLVGDIADAGEQVVFEATLSQLQSHSPEIAAAIATIQRAQCNLQRQRIEPRPNVSVEGLINWRDNGIGGDADGGLVVSLPLPLWNKNQGGIREARGELIAAERALGQLENGLKNRLAPVFERYRNAAQQADRYRDRILPMAVETLELTRETYELGEINFVNLLTVQRTYANNQLAYLDALESLRVALIEINGLLLSGSLDNR
jgi:cobalt-zinc-cadmium efflux system outer membrane protein